MECMTPMSPGLDGWREERQSKCAVHPIQLFRGSYIADGLRENGDQIEEKSKNDSEKAIIAFKFDLVVYLKDLLYPYWKDGKLSKDTYKMIVRKCVYKVINSFGDSEVPPRRKISDYLKASHSKLSKLVQAYVEKYQKDKEPAI